MTTSAFPSTDPVKLPTSRLLARNGAMTAGQLVVVLFCAQPEHAIPESYTTGATKNYRSSGDSQRPTNVRMTIDEDSRNPETDPQNHARALQFAGRPSGRLLQRRAMVLNIKKGRERADRARPALLEGYEPGATSVT